MEIEKIKSELSFLKAQFQPHFFSIRSNNIYSLTIDNSPTGRKVDPAIVWFIKVRDL